MSSKKLITLFLILISTLKFSAQGTHLLGFDDKKFHFGFALSYNQSDFYIQKSVGFNFNDDSLQSLVVNPNPGFSLGVVSSINFNPNRLTIIRAITQNAHKVATKISNIYNKK